MCRVAYCFFDVVLDADQKDSRRHWDKNGKLPRKESHQNAWSLEKDRWPILRHQLKRRYDFSSHYFKKGNNSIYGLLSSEVWRFFYVEFSNKRDIF